MAQSQLRTCADCYGWLVALGRDAQRLAEAAEARGDAEQARLCRRDLRAYCWVVQLWGRSPAEYLAIVADDPR